MRPSLETDHRDDLDCLDDAAMSVLNLDTPHEEIFSPQSGVQHSGAQRSPSAVFPVLLDTPHDVQYLPVGFASNRRRKIIMVSPVITATDGPADVENADANICTAGDVSIGERPSTERSLLELTFCRCVVDQLWSTSGHDKLRIHFQSCGPINNQPMDCDPDPIPVSDSTYVDKGVQDEIRELRSTSRLLRALRFILIHYLFGLRTSQIST